MTAWLPTHPDHQPDGDAVLLATADQLLRAEVQRLAAGAGCHVRCTADPTEVRRAWPLGAAVMVGPDLAPQLSLLGLPRRDGVHVVAEGAVGGDGLRAAVVLGAESVVELPVGGAHLAGLLGDLVDRGRPPGRVVGVVGGSGGVGASVLTVAMATVAAARGPAVAVDLDPGGAGLELVAGLGQGPPLGWEGLADGHGRINGRALREALAGEHDPAVLGWGAASRRTTPSPSVVAETLGAARRGHDLVVVDAADPGATPCLDAVVLVVGATVAGIAAAGRRLVDLPAGVPVGVAVRATRGDRWGRDAARALSLPLWTVVTHQRGLDDHLSAGLGPVGRRRSPLARSATEVLEALGAGS